MHDHKPPATRIRDFPLSGLVRSECSVHESRLYELARFHPAVIGAVAGWAPNVGQEGRS